MVTVPRRPEDAGHSHLAVTLWAHPTDVPVLDRPPVRPDMMVLRPTLRLPAGLSIGVDLTAHDTDAAAWWEALSVEAVYASMWHANRARLDARPRHP